MCAEQRLTDEKKELIDTLMTLPESLESKHKGPSRCNKRDPMDPENLPLDELEDEPFIYMEEYP